MRFLVLLERNLLVLYFLNSMVWKLGCQVSILFYSVILNGLPELTRPRRHEINEVSRNRRIPRNIMSIDQYANNFDHLVSEDLPGYLTALESDMKTPRSMGEFAIDGVGVTAPCRNFGLENDFPGCYVCLRM